MAEATGLRNNALNYPVYGAPYGVTFPILDADGDLVTGAASLDSEISKNGDTFGDCSNEATEIATSSGMYYLLLTAAELTTDVATIIVKTATAGAKTTPLVLYPRKLVTLRSGTAAGGAAGSITLDSGAAGFDDAYNGCLVVGTLDSNVEARIITDYTGSSKVATVVPDWVTTPDSDDTFIVYLPEGMQVPQADVRVWLGTAAATPTVAGVPEVDMTHLVGVAQSATDLKDFADDGYDPATNKVQGVALVDTVTTVSGDVNGDLGGSVVGSVQGNVDGNVAGDLGGDVVGNVQGNVNGSVGSVAGDVTGNLLGDIGGLSVGAAADFFLVNSGQTYGTAIAGSVVKEIADNATVTGTPNVNVTQISGDSVAADNLETALDGGVFNVGGGGVIAASVTGNVGGNVTGSVGSVAAGGITAASIATGAVDADALATDAVNEIADGLLGRNVAGGSSTGRIVSEALYFLRNRWVVNAGTLTVYATDDATPSWTATVSSDAAADPIVGNDPS